MCFSAEQGAKGLSRRFKEAIHSLTMAAGDADTNCAVAGALLGCAFGRKALPEDWLQRLPHLGWLEEQAQSLAQAGKSCAMQIFMLT